MRNYISGPFQQKNADPKVDKRERERMKISGNLNTNIREKVCDRHTLSTLRSSSVPSIHPSISFLGFQLFYTHLVLGG
jgi:hypothetical protein